MEEKIFNTVVVFADGRGSTTTNLKAKDEKDAIKKLADYNWYIDEKIVSITVIERVEEY